MKRDFRWIWGVLGFLVASEGLAAEDLVTGPPPETALAAVPCYANTGSYAGRESFDAAAEIASSPGLLLFIHVLNRNTAPVIRGVDHLAREYGLFGFKSFVVTLSDDRTAAEEQLRRVNGSLRLNQPMVLSLDGLDGPGGLALNRRCTLSVIAVNAGRVVGSLGLTDTGLHDLERIRALAETAIGPIPEDRSELVARAAATLPEDVESLRALAAQQAVELYRFHQQTAADHANSRRYDRRGRERMNRSQASEMRRTNRPRDRVRASEAPEPEGPKADGAKPKRRGKAPEDATLNSLLRSYIRKTNDPARVEEIFGQIEKRRQESDRLHQQAIEMFQLMLSFPERYGTEEAQVKARAFLREHNAQ